MSFGPARLNRVGVATTIAFLLIGGCGSGVPLRIAPTVPRAYPLSPKGKYNSYRAFGDSITAGYLLDDPKKAYPYLVGADRDLNTEDLAISGEQVCDVIPRQIFPNWSRNSDQNRLYSLLIGTNDVWQKNVGAYEEVFNQCHLGAIAWLAIPDKFKILTGDSSINTKGDVRIDNFEQVNILTTNSQGASITFAITTVRNSSLYAWMRIDDNSSGTYDYLVDGKVLGSAGVRTKPAIATNAHTSSSFSLLRLPVVDPGNHIITFIQTSNGSDGFSVAGVAAPSNADNLPTVLVGTIPYETLFVGNGPCVVDDTPCLTYIRDIEKNVKLLQDDGLDVRLFDTRKYMMGNSSEMTDAVHPNALGQKHLSLSVESSF